MHHFQLQQWYEQTTKIKELTGQGVVTLTERNISLNFKLGQIFHSCKCLQKSTCMDFLLCEWNLAPNPTRQFSFQIRLASYQS